MTTFILIILLHGNAYANMHSIEFNTLAACQAVQFRIETNWGHKGRMVEDAFCVKK